MSQQWYDPSSKWLLEEQGASLLYLAGARSVTSCRARQAEVVQPRQAFAWNPTVTGSKIEDTALLIDDRIDVITSTPDWPAISLNTRDRPLSASGVWRLN